MRKYLFHFLGVCILFLGACSANRQTAAIPPQQGRQTDAVETELPTRLPQEEPERTPIPSETPKAEPTRASRPRAACSIGIGLRKETIPILLKYKNRPGMVMSASTRLSRDIFPLLDGWTRILGAPSLATMEQRAERAVLDGIPFEGMGYGLETGQSTPDEEWQDLLGSTRSARDIVKEYDKLLVMGPGFKLMAQNEEMYPPMAALSDIWMLQTQQLQKEPPGKDYRQEVVRLVEQIREDSPGISIWAQITLPPDRSPDAQEWLAYRQSIADVVDGTYIGVYTWGFEDREKLSAAVDEIFSSVCEEK